MNSILVNNGAAYRFIHYADSGADCGEHTLCKWVVMWSDSDLEIPQEYYRCDEGLVWGVDPMFVDADNGDYSVRPGSPAIDITGLTAQAAGIGRVTSGSGVNGHHFFHHTHNSN
jgi:hypothetical protein